MQFVAAEQRLAQRSTVETTPDAVRAKYTKRKAVVAAAVGPGDVGIEMECANEAVQPIDAAAAAAAADDAQWNSRQLRAMASGDDGDAQDSWQAQWPALPYTLQVDGTWAPDVV